MRPLPWSTICFITTLRMSAGHRLPRSDRSSRIPSSFPPQERSLPPPGAPTLQGFVPDATAMSPAINAGDNSSYLEVLAEAGSFDVDLAQARIIDVTIDIGAQEKRSQPRRRRPTFEFRNREFPSPVTARRCYSGTASISAIMAKVDAPKRFPYRRPGSSSGGRKSPPRLRRD